MHDLDAMQTEWEAWTEGVVQEFRALGMDINEIKYNALVNALKLWGEELAQLRSKQDGPTNLTALIQAREAYRSMKAPTT